MEQIIDTSVLTELEKSKSAPCSEMVTSTTSSSLASPVDSGVQLCDSESEPPSTMSNSILEIDPKTPVDYFDRFERTCTKSETVTDELFEMEHPIGKDPMQVSLNSYELLDYTQQNAEMRPQDPTMHVSMSEEVKVEEEEAPKPPPADDQIVYRRQRKKKTKSDTPKKRVSFHEDILNSTKIDDVHIEHGFITRRPDDFRYSWAAEGETHYRSEVHDQRQVKSDLYANNRFGSTSSSSSTGSISSSIDEEDECVVKKEPSLKQPKSSCLKKSRSRKIDTKIVEEEIRRKRDENNLFGSLKNILNFSSSVPLAERGVPEGQEDVAVYSASYDSTKFTENETQIKRNTKLNLAKSSLRLTASEGFYPNYPKRDLPPNVIVCDSNVYEHRGISYTYEFDQVQREKPKSTSIYQLVLDELKFFRRKPSEESGNATAPPDDFVMITPQEEQKNVVQSEIDEIKSMDLNVDARKSDDWSDDTETVTEATDNSRHLSSPKRRVTKPNHYSLSPFKSYDLSRNFRPLSTTSSKNSLINRFLKSVTQKKMMEMARNGMERRKNVRSYMDLYVKGYERPSDSGRDELDSILEEEIEKFNENHKPPNDVDGKRLGQIRKDLLRDKTEEIRHIFPVRSVYATSGESRSLLIILTNTTLYVAGYRTQNTFCNHFVLPYTELDTILIGPNAQILHLSNRDRDMQCMVTTGCGTSTNDLIGRLEMAMRRDANRPRLVAVKQLTMKDMVTLRKAICRQTSVDKDEDYFYYSIVNVQDCQPDILNETPLGPNKEGPLMFKTNQSDTRWETAYFILKAGVLYMLSTASQRVPLRVFPLINGACQGARRVYDGHRPHTFQLIIEGRSLFLAAPDEYVASDWLQCLVHAASGTYQRHEKSPTLSCTLLMTSDHILTVREAFPCMVTSLLPLKGRHEPIKGAQALSCAAIADLVAFRLPSAEQSWCILEFSCREVHECSGDWILYFATNVELECFISTLEMLWAYNNENDESFPLSTIPETDPLSKRCVDVYNSLKNYWPANTVHLQFL